MRGLALLVLPLRDAASRSPEPSKRPSRDLVPPTVGRRRRRARGPMSARGPVEPFQKRRRCRLAEHRAQELRRLVAPVRKWAEQRTLPNLNKQRFGSGFSK